MVRDRGDRTTHNVASPPMPASKSRGATTPPRGHDDHEPQMLRPPMITPSHTRLQAQRSVVSLDLTSSTPAMESTEGTVGERSPMGLSDVVELPGSGCMAIILLLLPHHSGVCPTCRDSEAISGAPTGAIGIPCGS